MSAANAEPNISHLPHTAHPLPLREQAFTLHCQGLRSPAIAQALGVPERTIRAWIASALYELKDDLQLSRREQLLLAVERQHQLTAAAWQQFEREASVRAALLDATVSALFAATEPPAEPPADSTNSATSSTRPITIRLPASSLAPRYLSLILQANKEANRLLGLHTLARLQLLSPDPDAAPADFDIPAETATAAMKVDIAAETATASAIPAETATASATDSERAAETATASNGLAAGFQPVNAYLPPTSAKDLRPSAEIEEDGVALTGANRSLSGSFRKGERKMTEVVMKLAVESAETGADSNVRSPEAMGLWPAQAGREIRGSVAPRNRQERKAAHVRARRESGAKGQSRAGRGGHPWGRASDRR